MGDGLAPFRIVDTYHMIFIAHYHYLTWRLRSEKKLPKLQNHNDLPTETPTTADVEAGVIEKVELSVLTEKQQARLDHHAQKYSRSHTFYRPHETETHFAFPVKLLITITVLLDFHSIFQIALGSCTWSINYHVRPQALTATILSCSIACNISAGITIAVGDRMSRKKEVIEQHFRQDLTKSAIKKVQKERKKDINAGEPVDIPRTYGIITDERVKEAEPLQDEHNQLQVVDNETELENERSRQSSCPDSPTNQSRSSTTLFSPLPPLPPNPNAVGGHANSSHSRNPSTHGLPPLPTSPPAEGGSNPLSPSHSRPHSRDSNRRRSNDSARSRSSRRRSRTSLTGGGGGGGDDDDKAEPFPSLPDTPTYQATSPTVRAYRSKKPRIAPYPGT